MCPIPIYKSSRNKRLIRATSSSKAKLNRTIGAVGVPQADVAFAYINDEIASADFAWTLGVRRP